MKNFVVSFTTKTKFVGGNVVLAWTDEEFVYEKICYNPSTFEEGVQGVIILDDSIYVTSNNRLAELDFDFKLKRYREFQQSGSHQLTFYKGYLYLVMTHDNCILTIDINDLSIRDIYFHQRFSDDIDPHINTIHWYEDLRFITVHNQLSEGYVYCVTPNNSKFVVARHLFKPHDFQIIDDRSWVVCDSENFDFIYSTTPIEHSRTIKCPSFTRGFCCDNDFFYVGSSNRKTKEKCITKIRRNDFTAVNYPLENKFEDVRIDFCPELYSICRNGNA